MSSLAPTRLQRSAYWLTLALVVIMAGVSFVQSLAPIGTTFPGFQVLSDGRVSNILSPTWNGVTDRVPKLSPVVAIDGRPVQGGRDVVRRTAALAPGTLVTYRFSTPGGSRTIAVATQAYGWPDWLVTTFLAWVLGVGHALVGAVVSWWRPGHPVARLHFVACMLLAAYFLCIPDAVGTHQVVTTALYLGLYILGFGSWGLLATVFPRRLPAARVLQALWFVAVGSLIAWVAVDVARQGWAGPTIGWIGWGSLSALSLPASAAWTLTRRDSTPHERAVGKVLLVGIGIPFLISVVEGWLNYLRIPAGPLVTISYLDLLAFPLAVAYAIVRLRLFGIDLVIRRTVVYSLVGGGMLVLYAGVIGLSRLFLEAQSQAEGLIATITVVLAVGPWRDRVKAGLDRHFFRAPYDPTAVMAAFRQHAGDSLEAEHLIVTYAACLEKYLAVRSVTVRLANGLTCQRGGLDADPSPPWALPLTFDGTALGEAQIGTKRSDLPFSDTDRQVIEELTQRLAIWLHLIDRIAEDRRHRAKIAALQEADAMKSEFLNLVSHELRRPLSEILANVNLLARRDARQPADRPNGSLGQLQTSASMLANLVNDLLDAGQLQSGRFRLRPGPLDIALVIADGVDAMQPSADQKDVRLVAEVPPCPPAWGDHLRLVQVLTNLLSNAVRHAPAGSTVRVRVDVAPEQWTCTVSDEGEGIPAAALPTLFERFGGQSPEHRRPGAGLGLGLYICHSLVTAHGGTIAVDSAPGQGCTFRFAVPLKSGDPAAGAV